MYLQLVILSVISTVTFASPGNLGYGFGLGGVYSGNSAYGTNQVSVASGSASAAVSAVAAAPAVVAAAPIATSAQGRLDVITPSQVINQVSVLPVPPLRTVAVGGHGGAVAGVGIGLAGGVPGGLSVRNGLSGYGSAGYDGSRGGVGGYGY